MITIQAKYIQGIFSIESGVLPTNQLNIEGEMLSETQLQAVLELITSNDHYPLYCGFDKSNFKLAFKNHYPFQ